MIFIFGVIFVLAGFATLFFFLKKVKKPKADATIDEITLQYHEKDQQRIKKHPHGHIRYFYRSVEYKAVILLMKRKMQPGDQITVSFKEEFPEKPYMYAPKQELIAITILMAVGLALMGVSVFVMDYFDLW